MVKLSIIYNLMNVYKQKHVNNVSILLIYDISATAGGIGFLLLRNQSIGKVYSSNIAC